MDVEEDNGSEAAGQESSSNNIIKGRSSRKTEGKMKVDIQEAMKNKSISRGRGRIRLKNRFRRGG